MGSIMRGRFLAATTAVAATGLVALGTAAGASAHSHHHSKHHSKHHARHHSRHHAHPRHHEHTGAGAPTSGAPSSGAQFTASVLVNGATLTHQLAGGGSEALSSPDDITYLGGHIFVAFQNGVGPQGQASSSGNLDSTIVEFTHAGTEVTQWDVTGKVDGLTADPEIGQLIATANEDANSSLYTIDPTTGSTPVHYQYAEALPHDGGTDAITIYHGVILASASAPGTSGTPASLAASPAVYVVKLDPANDMAYTEGLYSDGDPALVANTNATNFGATVNLALTDPDSSSVVPDYADRFAGDFMLDSQGDLQQIFFRGENKPLAVLNLSASIDDTVWPSGHEGTLYAVDNGNNQIDTVTGPFVRGSEVAAVTPCNANSAPATCPAPGFPANYLGQIDPYTGTITQLGVSGVTSFTPQSLLFLPEDQDRR